MHVFIVIVLLFMFIWLVIIAHRLYYIHELLRDEKKPFLREEPWTDDMWPEVKPKKGKPR